MEKAKNEVQRIVEELQDDFLLEKMIECGFGEITIRIQNSRIVLIEHNFKRKPYKTEI